MYIESNYYQYIRLVPCMSHPDLSAALFLIERSNGMSALQTEDAPSEPLVERRRGCVKLPAAVASVVVLAGLVLVAVEELGHGAAPPTPRGV